VEVVASGSGRSWWMDTLGYPGVGSNTLSIAAGVQRSAVTMSGSSPTLKAGQTDTITFTFSEAVTGFDNADVSVTGGALSTITKVNATTYTAVFTPAAGVDTQTATVQVVASGSGTSSWTDTLGNPGLASNTLSSTEDTKGGKGRGRGSPTLKGGQTDTITFTFSEAVNGFDNADVSVTGGTLSTITQVNATTYTAVFTPTANFEGTGSLQVVASGSGTSSWTDTLGNPGLASNTLSITEDTKGPTVTVTGNSPTLKAGHTHTISVTFSEAVTGFDMSDVSVTGGTLSTITQARRSSDPAVFTPTANFQGTGSLQVVASGTGTSSWTDTAGNPGTASNTFSITEDTRQLTIA